MAQPPDINDTFVREVDENLRRDQIRDFGKKYASWMIVGVVLFLVAAGAFIYWQNYRTQQSEKQVEQLSQIYNDIGAGKTNAAPRQLDELSTSGSKAVRASALFARAALALQQNDTKLATAKYRQIAADNGLPQSYRDAATIRQTALEFDSTGPASNEFHIQNSKPWPKGDYQVDIFLGDDKTPAMTKTFKVG